MIKPSVSFPKKPQPEITATMESLLEDIRNKSDPKQPVNDDTSSINNNNNVDVNNNNVKIATLKRPQLGGREITDDIVIQEMKQYKESKDSKKQKRSVSPKPGPSKTVTRKLFSAKIVPDNDDDDDDGDDDDDNCDSDDLCCVCLKKSPPALNTSIYLDIVNWAQCDKCSHWTHLKYCSPVRVVRRHSVFFCPHCAT